MTDVTSTPVELAWQRWRESRMRALRSPYGALALTGTFWFDDELVLDGVPGTWRTSDAGVTLTATPTDGLVVDGQPLVGTVAVKSDFESRPTTIVAGRVRLVLIDREGSLAVRVYDQDSAASRAFRGIDAYPFDARWVRPARFTPYEAGRTVRIAHVDGVERGLPLGGDLTFELDGEQVRLAVEVEPETREMQAVLSDATSGRTTYRFRFLDLDAPDTDGSVIADLNRLRLPPCAFSSHFVCPFPPPGNRLDVAWEAGEQRVTGLDHEVAATPS
jgi:uncharacterized protein (DUF1684 family)